VVLVAPAGILGLVQSIARHGRLLARRTRRETRV